ncbi:MAG: hypothetical protein HY553_20735 [Elusimicrobia bacterium]|nr:hypothetical protein [Elusimicrobiota bacterium]
MKRAALFSLLLLGCAAGQPRERWPDSPDGTVSRVGSYLQASGVGKPDPLADGKTQRRSTSRDAAILDARGRLIDYLKRIMIAEGVSAGERATEDEGWRRRLDQAATGIEVTETRWDDADTAVVVLRVERASVERALGLVE